MYSWTVKELTRLSRLLTPVERRALASITLAWVFGSIAGTAGWDQALADRLMERLHPELPTPEELAARLPPGDPRPVWYAAGLALREERARASGDPIPIDPNRAERADWDRLPGIGPRTAEAILAHRTEIGSFRTPDDLLAVRGIGPHKLEQLAPWLIWPEISPRRAEKALSAGVPGDKPRLNRVTADFLTSLPGIGPQLAAGIVRERRRRGGFRTWEEVLLIKGIGEAKLNVLREATSLAVSKSQAESTESHP